MTDIEALVAELRAPSLVSTPANDYMDDLTRRAADALEVQAKDIESIHGKRDRARLNGDRYRLRAEKAEQERDERVWGEGFDAAVHPVFPNNNPYRRTEGNKG